MCKKYYLPNFPVLIFQSFHWWPACWWACELLNVWLRLEDVQKPYLKEFFVHNFQKKKNIFTGGTCWGDWDWPRWTPKHLVGACVRKPCLKYFSDLIFQNFSRGHLLRGLGSACDLLEISGWASSMYKKPYLNGFSILIFQNFRRWHLLMGLRWACELLTVWLGVEHV